MSLYLFACLVLIIAPICTLIHELGHACGAKLVKADRIKLYLGIGKRQWTVALYDLELTFRSIYFVGGVTESKRDRPYKKSEIIWITFFGPMFNGVAATIIYIIHEVHPNSFLQLLFWFNVWMAVVNMIPFKFKGKQTDGFTIFNSISRK
ncbi:site-2 protease family protein [Oceanobacillus polygoni]|uniref:Membrane-associated protease RseP (Regulator of RpoE activity) n=1 Tax=Oceanobacillus polygoni TaxID=1235259 RepID=A0A9X0YTJ7_9BACI|nr:site-2 protease family protein [Oceanobacillus polygoni]MBP2077811.1 membrane-associated protease RseP (regulator of RpoE activity) [Oceanobacillus polygoni]